MCKTGGFLFPVKVTRFVSGYFLDSAKTICGPTRPTMWFAGTFLQEPCGLTQPAPEVPFFSKRKEPKIRQRGSFLFGFSSEGHIPSGTSQAKFSPPVCSASKQMSGFASTTSGSRVLLSSVLSTDTAGFQKGLAPFAGGQGTRWFLARLSSISSR